MGIVGGLDVHRAQITFDYADTASGEVHRGRVVATREGFGAWLDQFVGHPGGVEFVFEGCTGWRFVAEELAARGFGAHMAEPAEAALLRGPKKRAKTDRTDARHLRMLLIDDRVPLSWVPPPFVSDIRATGRLYKALSDDRRRWAQRVHAQLFHCGVPPVGPLSEPTTPDLLRGVAVPPRIGMYLDECLSMIDVLGERLAVRKADLKTIGRSHPGPKALQVLWGIGLLNSVIIWAELGDTRRFSSSRQAVRYTGLDITVHESDGHRSPGRLSRQGSSVLRWALVEAAHHASKKASPDYAYYQQARRRVGGSRAALSVARKITRRAHHILTDLGDDAWQPI